MEQIFIFDVDGTLTGPRRVMHEDFARFFRSVVNSVTVFLVTGSDMPRLAQQIPDWILRDCAGAFTCSGNEFWQEGQPIFQMHHAFPDQLLEFVESLIAGSSYPARTGRHIEARTGTLNASVVGRNANPLQRNDYFRFDRECGERAAMIEKISNRFRDYEANRGGQISIDIAPRGWNKSRVFSELKRRYPEAIFRFFGDNIRPGGNDLPLADAVRQGGPRNRVYPVADHCETWKILAEEFVASSSLAAG